MKLDFEFEKTSSNRVYINCPYCISRRTDKEIAEREDTKFHLMIDVKRDFYYCFRCSAQGKLDDINSSLGMKLKTEQYELPTIKERLKSLGVIMVKSFQGFSPQDIGLPISIHSEAYSYLKSRSISQDLIDYYGLLMGKGIYFNRVIIPEYKDSRIVYFTARAYKDVFPKYINPPIPKSDIVYNINKVTTDHCILTEGCFSAIAAGKSGIAVLGKKISFSQYAKISLKFRTVYVCLDPDVSRKAKESIRNNFLENGVNSGVIEGLRGDPNEVTREEFQSALEATKIYKPEQLPLLKLKNYF